MRPARWILAGLLVAALTGARAAPPTPIGELMYRVGVTETGQPIAASRQEGTRLTGAAVACVNCHRRSGLGAREGRTNIPPIAGRFLFESGSQSRRGGLPFVGSARTDREPYNEITVARAIREGIDSNGKALSYLMPRYALSDADMAGLISYLKTLDPRRQPGLTATVLHLATIVTPDADPVKRQATLQVLQQFVAERNARQRAPGPELMTSEHGLFGKGMFRPVRQWQLHVWQLGGAPESWGAQLDRLLAQQPVFAVLSGQGGRDWAPVHAFCERAALPCLFPNVDAPPADADRGFYSVYFTRGVTLEAELIAGHLDGARDRVQLVRQIYRAGDSGAAGARALAAQLEQKGIRADNVELPATAAAGAGVAEALAQRGSAQAVVLWLREPDVAALHAVPVPEGPLLYMSGLMAGFERSPLPAAWREQIRMAYPVDLPEHRITRVDFAMGWFRIHRIPVVAMREQADAFLACGLLSETLNHMADAVVREYLLERMEDMIEHRLVTGYYPRLSLAAGQRFASKGGYVVRFVGTSRQQGVLADSDWIVP
jgi:hypothetical protein